MLVVWKPLYAGVGTFTVCGKLLPLAFGLLLLMAVMHAPGEMRPLGSGLLLVVAQSIAVDVLILLAVMRVLVAAVRPLVFELARALLFAAWTSTFEVWVLAFAVLLLTAVMWILRRGRMVLSLLQICKNQRDFGLRPHRQ